jgi:hypothetical protein
MKALKAIALEIDPDIEYENPDGPGECVSRLSSLIEERGWGETSMMPEVRDFMRRLKTALRYANE